MASYEKGKDDVCKWIKDNFPKGATCLDVGACDGVWADKLNDYLVMVIFKIGNVTYIYIVIFFT